MGEILRRLDRDRIAALRAEERFFWIDLVLEDGTAAELERVLDIPDHAVRMLVDVPTDPRRRARFHADGDHVVFPFSCFLDSGPVEVHLLVSGDFLVSVHREHVALPDALEVELPEHRSEQYLIYAVLEAMVVTGFDALTDIEESIEEIQTSSTDLQSARIRIDTLRDITMALTRLRRQVAPQRGTFARVADEIGRVEGLEPDSEHYFDRIGDAINRLVDAIDAATSGVAQLIDLRVNETIYWLTVVATVFLPLTFITGFFGMNFGWMVRHITTPAAFLVLGLGGCAAGVALTLLAVRRRANPVATGKGEAPATRQA